MGAVMKVGGVLSLIGGALVLMQSLFILLGVSITGNFFEMLLFLGSSMPPPMGLGMTWPIISLLLGAVALVGGIISLAGKKAGGGLALVVAILWVIPVLLAELGVVVLALSYLIPMGMLTNLIGGYGLWIFTIEGILVLVGGIMGLAGSSD